MTWSNSFPGSFMSGSGGREMKEPGNEVVTWYHAMAMRCNGAMIGHHIMPQHGMMPWYDTDMTFHEPPQGIGSWPGPTSSGGKTPYGLGPPSQTRSVVLNRSHASFLFLSQEELDELEAVIEAERTTFSDERTAIQRDITERVTEVSTVYLFVGFFVCLRVSLWNLRQCEHHCVLRCRQSLKHTAGQARITLLVFPNDTAHPGNWARNWGPKPPLRLKVNQHCHSCESPS